MEEDFYFEESNPRKSKIILFILFVVVVIGVLLFILYRNRTTINVKKVVTYEAGSKLNTDILYYLNNKVSNLDDYSISFDAMITRSDVLDTVGEYGYKVTYKGVSKKGKIKVIDESAPEISTTKLVIGVDEDFIPDDALTKCEDYSLPCRVELVNSKDEDISKESGTYKVPIYVYDNNKNRKKITIDVEVKENYNSEEPKINDINPDHVSVDYIKWNGEYLIKFDKAIKESDLEEYDDAINEVLDGDLHRYIDPMYANNGFTRSEFVYVYNKYNYVVGITYYLKLDNGCEFFLNK